MSRRRCCCDPCNPTDCTTCPQSEMESRSVELIIAGLADCNSDCAGLCDAINGTYELTWSAEHSAGPTCVYTLDLDPADFDGYCIAEHATDCPIGTTNPSPPPQNVVPAYGSFSSARLVVEIEYLKSAAIKSLYGFASECNTAVRAWLEFCNTTTDVFGERTATIVKLFRTYVEGAVDCDSLTGVVLSPVAWTAPGPPGATACDAIFDATDCSAYSHDWTGNEWWVDPFPTPDGECVYSPGLFTCDDSAATATVTLL